MTIWTPDIMHKLAELWPRYSANIVAKHMGLTKNMVIGKARRMKLKKNPSYVKLPPIPIVRKPRGATKHLGWTEKQIEMLVVMAGDGHKLAEIVHTLDKYGPHHSADAIRRFVNTHGIQRKAYVQPKSQASITLVRHITLEKVPEFPKTGCVYPLGDVGADDFHFCGCQTVKISAPYCHEHTAICYVKGETNDRKNPAIYTII